MSKNPRLKIPSPTSRASALAEPDSESAVGQHKLVTPAVNEQHLTTGHLLSDLKGRTISSGFVTTIAQGVQFALMLLSAMVLARLLTPEDFGLVAMVLTITGFLRVFKDAGLSTATVQREGITHAQVSNLFWINVAISGLVSLIVAASAPAIASFYREPRLISITLVIAITFLIEGSTVQHMALLNRQMRFKMITLIQTGALLASIVVSIGMALLNYGYWSLVGAQVVLPLVALLLTWSASRWRPQLPVRGSGTRPLVNFGVNVSASGFMWSVARGADGMLIGRVYGSDSVGLYSRAAALLNRPLDGFLSSIGSVFMPVLSRVQDEPERYRRTFLQIYEAIALTSFFFTGFLFALARPLTLVVLGSKWEKAAVIFAGFSIAALFYPLATTTSWLLASQGRGRDKLRSSSIISCVTVAAFICGLPFGPGGVAIAYSISGVLILLPIVYYVAGRSGPVRTADLWLGFFRHLPVWVVVCGVAFLMRTLLGSYHPLTQLLVCGPVSLLAGTAFICIYAPARSTALTLISALQAIKAARTGPRDE